MLRQSICILVCLNALEYHANKESNQILSVHLYFSYHNNFLSQILTQQIQNYAAVRINNNIFPQNFDTSSVVFIPIVMVKSYNLQLQVQSILGTYYSLQRTVLYADTCNYHIDLYGPCIFKN